ncbi:MAG: NAD(P)/FAD-dependent oxidoreductase [Deltaproteobacteria bacterium]|nr:MAG: NAD(P)/FAD-dependent oxidoreductase [Deltaproteobacteria bacterium]
MPRNVYDIIILGSGPAGLQAAIHAARARTSVLVLGKPAKSSLHRAHIENYCCMGRVAGEDLLREGIRQAEQSGTVFLHEDVVRVSHQDQWFIVQNESGTDLNCRALILAMGISRNKLRVPGEKELLGRGVSYCVDCDAGFFRGEPVAVVGNESAAASGALTMLFYASQVHLVSSQLEVSESMDHQIRTSGIRLLEGRKVTEIVGENEVDGLVLDDDSRLDVKGVFIELGAKGAVELAAELGVAMDTESPQFIATDKKQKTNIGGVYAAGDICGLPWQLAKAVGEGCVAGLEAAAYAKKFR